MLTYFDILSTKEFSDSWNLADTVGVRGFIVTKRPAPRLTVLTKSELSFHSWNILDTI